MVCRRRRRKGHGAPFPHRTFPRVVGLPLTCLVVVVLLLSPIPPPRSSDGSIPPIPRLTRALRVRAVSRVAAPMGKDRRTTLPRRHSYATKSNRTKTVKTPGGRVVLHIVKKRVSGPRCAETGVALHGVRRTASPLPIPFPMGGSY